MAEPAYPVAPAQTDGPGIKSDQEFEKTPAGFYKYWVQEIESAQKRLEKWQKQADKIVNLYTGKEIDSRNTQWRVEDFKLNLFHSNVSTLMSMLYGNMPKVDVSRTFADSNDDQARVASEILERMLNLDIQQNGRELEHVLRSVLFDRLVPGLGCAKVRYDVEIEKIRAIQQVITGDQVENIETEQERLVSESAPIDYYYWGDLLWGWCRNWAENPWVAYANYLTKDQVKKRFPKCDAERLVYKKRTVSADEKSDSDPHLSSEWEECKIWEIWDKKTRRVYWVSVGYHKTLDIKDDPIGLKDFFPSPPFFIANPTTSLFIPTPDYSLAQDLYAEIDQLSTRISIITDAVKVVGIYDSGCEGVQRMLKEGTENDLIPVDNWAMLAEKGGLKGVVDWFPMEEVVGTLEKLQQIRSENIGLLQQTTGMADIMRGGLDSPYEGTGQTKLKARFGSVRVQALQDQFAQFVSDLLQIKAEIISLHFDPQTIAKNSNVLKTYDAQLAPQAIELIKNPEDMMFRVTVRPESVAMIDYAELKQERVEYINGLATFMQSAAPLVEMDKGVLPFLLELLKWGLAGFKGSNEIEGVIDKAAEQVIQQLQQQKEKPDPQAQQAQAQMQLEQAKAQAELQKIQAKSQADMAAREQDRKADLEQTLAEHETKMREIIAQSESKLSEIRAKLEADVVVESIQANMNMAQTQQQGEVEMIKDQQEAQLNFALQAQKAQDEIDKIAVNAQAKIKEATYQKSLEGDSDDD